MQRLLTMLTMVTAVLAASTTISGQATNPHVGTWRLNAAKSKYDPGPPQKTLTVTYAAVKDGLKLTTDGVDGQGRPTKIEYAAMLDGKDYPMKGNPDADMASTKRIDDRTIETIWKRDGKTAITLRSTVSADGKIRTVTQQGVDAQGRKINNVIVFDRQ